MEDNLKGIYSREQLLAYDIALYFNEMSRFGAYMKIIKRIGYNKTVHNFSIVKEGIDNIKKPAAYFFSLCSKNPKTKIGNG